VNKALVLSQIPSTKHQTQMSKTLE